MKNVGCIKTGAIVAFPQYDAVISADVFRVGDAIIVRTHPNQVNGNCHHWEDDRGELKIVSRGSEEFWRPDIGVFVVPEARVEFLTDAPWTKSEREF